MKIVFQQEALFSIPRNDLYGLFSSMENYARIHPVITKIKFIDSNTYRIFEKVPVVGKICIKTNYNSEIILDRRGDRVRYLAFLPMTKVVIDFSFHEKGNSTIVQERVEITGWFPVVPILKFFIAKYHRILLKNLEVKVLSPSMK